MYSYQEEYETAIRTLDNHVRYSLFPPSVDWPPEELKKRSYGRYFAMVLRIEFEKRLRCHSKKNPREIIEENISKYEQLWQEVDGDRDADLMYDAAIETLNDILMLFM